MAEQNKDLVVYVMDTSSWIKIDGHPAQNQILDAIYRLAANGQIKSPSQVFEEVKRTSDIKDWLAQHRAMIAETPTSDVDYLKRVGQVTAQFPAMQRARGTKERADAWVVGLAIHKKSNPEEWTVVADETTGKRANRKIPTACSAFGVKCMGLMGMLVAEFPDEEW